MRLPRRLRRINKRVTNPIQLRWAGRLPAHGIIEHVGRKTGKAYRTPVLLLRARGGGYAVLLGYGTDTDWVRNLRAAGRASVVHRGHRLGVTDPTVVEPPEAWALLPPRVAGVARRLGVEAVLHLTVE